MTTPDIAYKAGNEFAPYHPSASHVAPDYRDGWNACFKAAAAELERLRAQVAPTESMLFKLAGIAAECSDPDTTDALDVLIAATRAEPAVKSEPATVEYASAMGQAADDYINSLGGRSSTLPSRFRWQECLDIMLATSPAAPAQQADPLQALSDTVLQGEYEGAPSLTVGERDEEAESLRIRLGELLEWAFAHPDRVTLINTSIKEGIASQPLPERMTLESLNEMREQGWQIGLHLDEFPHIADGAMHLKSQRPSVRLAFDDLVSPAQQAEPAADLLREMVEMMDRGDEHGAGSDWHTRAVAALSAQPQPPAQGIADDRAAFRAYLQQCDECAIVPDVAGAFNGGWKARAALAQAPAAEPRGAAE